MVERSLFFYLQWDNTDFSQSISIFPRRFCAKYISILILSNVNLYSSDLSPAFTSVNPSRLFDTIRCDESWREEKDYGYQAECRARGWGRSALANPRAISEAHLPLLAFVTRGSAESLAKRAILCGLVQPFNGRHEVFYPPVAIYLHLLHTI